MLALTAQHRVIWNRPLTVTRGILNTTLVHPREVFVSPFTLTRRRVSRYTIIQVAKPHLQLRIEQ